MMKLRHWPAHQIVWRWHFYAGLFCIPFILLLSVTGGVYLFKPQVEAVLDTPYERLVLTGPAAPAHHQVQAALQAVPGAILHAYELPVHPQSAVRVLVKQGQVISRVYVHPQTLQVLNIAREDAKVMRIMHELHGNLLLGARGSYLVELAASWAIVMVITGLYLWWPKAGQGLAGVVFPRLGRSSRLFWRDLHAVTGFWVAIFTLFLLISGLPWTKSWGGMLKEIRQTQITGAKMVKAQPQDWTIGGLAAEEHAAHTGHMPAWHSPGPAQDYRLLDQLVATVAPLQLAPPVLIAPPSEKSTDWTARSDAQNRPLRVNIRFDAAGHIASRKNFADRPWLDRVIGVGVAIHEGQLFGWLNQALGALTALGLVLLSVSSVVLWWQRLKNTSLLHTLGAPPRRQPAPYAWAMIGMVLVLGLLLPFFGLSLLLVLGIERGLMLYFPRLAGYLGLDRTYRKVES
ncbi:Uncharacterized iron-regulated membrane protein [Methylophilus rhizosphaerae]|uniref:Uncharacterized iron-regulated membrane protein n=1 Tax=Methylophilus rhizosphaerae TaxID=492660 RepID=A0A1G9EVB6_9PROT|nr:PepSY domain-containing protein [Methylophilus rhizosphaerae]SDK80106.1 Uncharacterized iron-regulated membrane protein [Methylophilus rhizosphaerae]